MQPTILLYGCTRNEMQLEALRQVLDTNQIHARFLAREELDLTIQAAIEHPWSGKTEYPTPEETDFALVLINRSERAEILQLHQLLAPVLEAVDADFVSLTENNRDWTWRDLLRHLVDEKAYLKLFFGLQQQLEVLSDLREDSYTPSSWKTWKTAHSESVERLYAEPEPTIDELKAMALRLRDAYSSLATQPSDADHVDGHLYDLIIIGAGPAGVSAALYTRAMGLDLLVFEREAVGGLIRKASWVTHYTGLIPGESGIEFGDRLQAQLETAGVPLRYEAVTAVELAGAVKKVRTAAGTYLARSILLATGTSPKTLPLEQTYSAGQATADTAETIRGREIFVLGGSDGAVKQALFFARTAARVHLVQDQPSLLALPEFQAQIAELDNLVLHTSTSVDSLSGEGSGKITEVSLKNHETNTTTTFETNPANPFHVFVYIGQTPNNALADGQLTLEDGYLAHAGVETELEGVFVAGDIAVKKVRQIATAVNDGCLAAQAIRSYVETEKQGS